MVSEVWALMSEVNIMIRSGKINYFNEVDGEGTTANQLVKAEVNPELTDVVKSLMHT